jgi:hypothetical protein
MAYGVTEAAPIVTGDRVHLIGGRDTSNATVATVQSATFNAGTDVLGAFSSGGSLAAARKGAMVERVGNYVYVLGGQGSSGTNLTSVERAAINGDGSLGAFATVAGVALTVGRYNSTSVNTGSYLYVAGGGWGPLASVERAAINADGSIGNFSGAGITLNVARWTAAGARIGNTWYVIGGEDAAGALSSIEKATVAADGSLGAFTTDARSLSVKRNRLTAVALSGTLYLMGGWNSTFLTAIDSATIGADDTLGAFSAAAATLAVGVESGFGILRPTAAYYFGGNNGSGVQNIVQKATIQ